MTFSVGITFIVLTSIGSVTAAAKDCALAGKLDNQHINKENETLKDLDKRRYDSSLKYKFGITYPPGAEPQPTTDRKYTTFAYPQWGMRTIVTADLYPWRNKPTHKTPPTNFFPLGSTDVTVTVFPLPWQYVHEESFKNPCDLWIRSCMRAYDTGWVCARALHLGKLTFSTYCSMEYANCNFKNNVWQLAYFGNCDVERIPDNGEDFDIEGDNFLEAAVINAPKNDPILGY